MPKAELGVKRKCLSCGAPFFDLNRDPILCAKCGAPFQIVELARSPPRRAWSHQAPNLDRPVAAAAAEDETAADEADDAGEEATLPPIDDDDDEADQDVRGEVRPTADE